MRVNHPFIVPPHLQSLPYSNIVHDHCAIYAPPPTAPFYAIHHIILVIAISCEGQYSGTLHGLVLESRDAAVCKRTYVLCFRFDSCGLELSMYISE